jgi:hypothetical protein
MILQAIIPLSRGLSWATPLTLPGRTMRFAIFEHIDYLCKSIFKRLRPLIVTSRADAGSVSRKLS